MGMKRNIRLAWVGICWVLLTWMCFYILQSSYQKNVPTPVVLENENAPSVNAPSMNPKTVTSENSQNEIIHAINIKELNVGYCIIVINCEKRFGS